MKKIILILFLLFNTSIVNAEINRTESIASGYLISSIVEKSYHGGNCNGESPLLSFATITVINLAAMAATPPNNLNYYGQRDNLNRLYNMYLGWLGCRIRLEWQSPIQY